MTETVQLLLERNAAHAARHAPLPPLPALDTIVICCLDARVDPAHFLGLEPGEALVLRNAGGRVTEAVEREIGAVLALVEHLTGQASTAEVLLVHHTDCGMERLAAPATARAVSQAAGIDLASLRGLAIAGGGASMREDLRRLRESRLVPRALRVTGLRYDDTTGRTTVFEEVSNGTEGAPCSA